jgi:hypothetical protein
MSKGFKGMLPVLEACRHNPPDADELWSNHHIDNLEG